MNLLSNWMSQPDWLQGRSHRRESVVVDGDRAWALFCACADGCDEQVENLIAEDRDLIYAQIWYQQPIDLAIREGHLSVVKTLLVADEQRRLGSRVYHSHHYRMNIGEIERRGHLGLAGYLHNYARSLVPDYDDEIERLGRLPRDGNPEDILAAVSSNPILVDRTDGQGRTMLHLAIENQDFLSIVKTIDAGASITATTVGGATPMDCAVNFFPAAIPVLIDYKIQATPAALVALGMTDALRARLTANPEIANAADPFGVRPLARAARHRNSEVAKLLIEFGADPNLPGPDSAHGDALYIATEHWDHATMELLLSAGANPNAEVDSSGCCLSLLVDHERWGNHPAREAHDALTQFGAFIPPYAMTHGERLHFLQASNPTKILSEYDGGWSEMHHHLATVEELDLYVARVGNAKIAALWSDIQYANIRTPDYTHRLVHHGMDINRRDWLGRTLLHAAAADGDIPRAELLLSLGAELDPVCVHSRTTPIAYAARLGEVEMVRWLIDQGASIRPDTVDWGQPVECVRGWRLDPHNSGKSIERFAEVINVLG